MFKYLLIAAVLVACVVADDESHAEIVSLKSDVRPDGYDASVETTNHISQSSSGDEHGNAHGQFEWKTPEGGVVSIHYTADEHGYQPVGDVIPTPHPIPEAIVKALAYLEAHPYQGDKH